MMRRKDLTTVINTTTHATRLQVPRPRANKTWTRGYADGKSVEGPECTTLADHLAIPGCHSRPGVARYLQHRHHVFRARVHRRREHLVQRAKGRGLLSQPVRRNRE